MMTTPRFTSGFAETLSLFIDHKRALGHLYDGSVELLRRFDAMCSADFPGRADLAQDVCLAWAVRRPNESSNALRNRLSPIREFARFLIRRGERAYLLPPDMTRKTPPHVPHIYTPAQIAAIWSAADATAPLERSPIRHLVIPAILRMIYCCGLRPVEARTLPTSAVDLERGRLLIAESKGHKDRHVWMAEDLTDYLRAFDADASWRQPGREAFFSDSRGLPYSKAWLDKTFRTIRDQTGITGTGRRPPRLYDLRH